MNIALKVLFTLLEGINFAFLTLVIADLTIIVPPLFIVQPVCIVVAVVLLQSALYSMNRYWALVAVALVAFVLTSIVVGLGSYPNQMSIVEMGIIWVFFYPSMKRFS